MGRLAVILVLAAVVALLAFRYRRGVAADAERGGASAGTAWPIVPAAQLVPDVACTWMVFTTPWCASCDQVKATLAEAFPHHGVRTVDATVEVALGEAFEVQRAPTTLLVDRHGRVLERLVGPEAVRSFVMTPEAAALGA